MVKGRAVGPSSTCTSSYQHCCPDVAELQRTPITWVFCVATKVTEIRTRPFFTAVAVPPVRKSTFMETLGDPVGTHTYAEAVY